MNHELKILPCYFEAVACGDKTFEIRDGSDRDFQRGDTVRLREWEAVAGYTGRIVDAEITYVTNYEQKDGFVVFGIKNERIKQMTDKRECSNPDCTEENPEFYDSAGGRCKVCRRKNANEYHALNRAQDSSETLRYILNSKKPLLMTFNRIKDGRMSFDEFRAVQESGALTKGK